MNALSATSGFTMTESRKILPGCVVVYSSGIVKPDNAWLVESMIGTVTFPPGTTISSATLTPETLTRIVAVSAHRVLLAITVKLQVPIESATKQSVSISCQLPLCTMTLSAPMIYSGTQTSVGQPDRRAQGHRRRIDIRTIGLDHDCLCTNRYRRHPCGPVSILGRMQVESYFDVESAHGDRSAHPAVQALLEFRN